MFEIDTQNWLERGAGLLRLNDMQGIEEGDFQSRLGKYRNKQFIIQALKA